MLRNVRAPLLAVTLVACRNDNPGEELGSTAAESSSGSTSTDTTDSSSETATDTDDTSTTEEQDCMTAADCAAPAPCEAEPTCEAGSCMYAALPVGSSCDEGDPCTSNVCDGAGGCLSSTKVCNEPPAFDVAAACSGGQPTFQAPGACGGSCNPQTGACEYPDVELACPPDSAALAQDHPYQVVLRNFLATLDESDFELTLAPVSYQPSDLADDEARYQQAILLANNGYYAPSSKGLVVPASVFTPRRSSSPVA
jgi:hypothetical protein